MFKVGMGGVPPIPPTLSEEGQSFLGHLLQHDPRLRYSAQLLLEHNFLKVWALDQLYNNYYSIIKKLMNLSLKCIGFSRRCFYQLIFQIQFSNFDIQPE